MSKDLGGSGLVSHNGEGWGGGIDMDFIQSYKQCVQKQLGYKNDPFCYENN